MTINVIYIHIFEITEGLIFFNTDFPEVDFKVSKLHNFWVFREP
jgi:hypothetical protein